jgi:periplasmic protein TonB
VHPRQHTFNLNRTLPGVAAAVVSVLLAACSSKPPSSPESAPPVTTIQPSAVQPQAKAPSTSGRSASSSSASSPRAYRADAAAHLYELNRERIYKGRLPPLLYAIGVLQVEVDGRGNVRDLRWMRAPKHAPEVVAEIERTVRAAAPFPAPARMGKVVYTDTWLWHKSGHFQLDTLTEGQD